MGVQNSDEKLFIFKKSYLSARTTTPKKFLLLFYQLSMVERRALLGLEYNFLLFEVEQAHLPRYWDKLTCSLINYALGLGIVF